MWSPGLTSEMFKKRKPAQPPAKGPNSGNAFGIGDKVKLSDRGQQRFREHLDRRGLVVAVSATKTSYRIRWDNFKTAEFLHWSYLTRDDQRSIEINRSIGASTGRDAKKRG